MVWDGLRPDFVTQRDTPNLFRMAREGVRFDRHHSIFPTLTMVNATALATGAPPGVNGLEGNNFYLAPSPETPKGQLVSAEGAKAILNLNGANAFKGRLIGLDTIAQEVAREGGYVAVIGKQGPTSVFDNRVATIADGKDIVGEPHQDYLFASEDFVATSSSDENIRVPPDSKTAVADEQRDLYFARLAVEDALPAAKRAADAGRPALVVFWQHNPDLTQHIAGLGTAARDGSAQPVRQQPDARARGDRRARNRRPDRPYRGLGPRLRDDQVPHRAVRDAGGGGTQEIARQYRRRRRAQRRRGSDLPVADRIRDAGIEAARCCRRSSTSPRRRNGAGRSSRAILRSSRRNRAARGHRQRAPKPYLGWIDGTFSQRVVGLYNAARSPDLVISFREEPDADNKALTGPGNPAFLIGQIGQVSTPNKSADLIHPVKGVVYADTGTSPTFTTGMGMHGAAGEREIHNFCAAAGPDFRRGFVDLNPTANTDVTPTITQILGTADRISAPAASCPPAARWPRR